MGWLLLPWALVSRCRSAERRAWSVIRRWEGSQTAPSGRDDSRVPPSLLTSCCPRHGPFRLGIGEPHLQYWLALIGVAEDHATAPRVAEDTNNAVLPLEDTL